MGITFIGGIQAITPIVSILAVFFAPWFARKIQRNEILASHLQEKNQKHLENIQPHFVKFLNGASDGCFDMHSYNAIMILLRPTNPETCKIVKTMQDIAMAIKNNEADICIEHNKAFILYAMHYIHIESEAPTCKLSGVKQRIHKTEYKYKRSR